MKEKSTRLYGHPIYGTGRIIIEFDENGWQVIEDTRSEGHIGGYLHLGVAEDEVSSEEITNAVRDNIIKYMYKHPMDLPGLGATPQRQYFDKLTLNDLEAIGNDGEPCYYA